MTREPPPALSDFNKILEWAWDQAGDADESFREWGGSERLFKKLWESQDEFEAGKPFSEDIKTLRGVLFWFQRGHRHTDMGGPPNPAEVAFVRALFDTIRSRWHEQEEKA